MSNVDVNKIANLIADIQSAQAKIEEEEDNVKKLERELEDAKLYIEEEEDNVKHLREQLEDYLDELIPEREPPINLKGW